MNFDELEKAALASGIRDSSVTARIYPRICIQALAPNQLNEVVQLHLEAFPGFFLCFLGPRFLREFYKSFLNDPQGIAYVACDEASQILGVVAGPLDPGGYFKRLLRRRWWAFCLASVRSVLRQPGNAPRIWRALYYRGESPPGPVRALLSSVAVLPAAQGRNVGRALVLRWLNEARRRGATGCYLTTDADENDKANAFYRSLHWQLECNYTTPEGRRMNRYVLDFSPDGSEAKAALLSATPVELPI